MKTNRSPSPIKKILTGASGKLSLLVGTDVPDSGCPLASLTKGERQGGAWSASLQNDTTHLENGPHAPDRLA
ncbi:hypothetical protein [Salinibacter altiplanensis]|uniref:hypothetical protein n=1 Tax=Salinibacter altiplanensis TaxID=1803181 RepID=UPI001E47C782|nr:hypothetical protein [Salinibacter altiplanensis]